MANQLWELIKEILFRNRDRHAIPSLDGPLRPNNLIDRCLVICDNLKHPDAVAIDADGFLYVSSENRVVRLSGESYNDQEVFAEFEGNAGGLSFHPDGRLMVCISGKGLAIISRDGATNWIQMEEDKSIRCPTAAVAGPDGEVYITEGTTHHNPENWVWDLMEKNTAGRLLRHSIENGKTETLLSGLGYPHGLVISHDKASLLLTESWKHSLLRYPLNDIRQGSGERIIDNMPGYPARITQSSEGGYWMCLFAPRNRIVEFVLREENYREHMMKDIEPAYWVAPALCSGVDFLEPLQAGAARTLGVMKPWAPPRSYGLVISLGTDLELIGSLHCRVDGERHGITGLCEHDDKLYITSKGHSLVLLADEGVLL